ncbi:hypothetical protein [Vagococcus fluvialis]|uniref:hypothetical protein n=1 Tax=Vagococcus fluvialis TaxID=2738 RepID=UPI001A8C5760|nr:hypothetical protein [Vagococcus fluvialis]MBO0488518.1 hypothetical protein [Vagococcus fluvialis]UDM81166.1 hypothetical protein K5K97_14080 [Vagococcus fluvialis]
MFDKSEKIFKCNRCSKKIESAETCWTKWQFPPKANSFQDKSIKALEYQNAPILCLECADEIMAEKF